MPQTPEPLKFRLGMILVHFNGARLRVVGVLLRVAGATGGMPMYATSFNPTYTSVDVYINHQSTASAPSPAHRTCTESHPLLPSHPSTGLRDARHHILPQSAGGSATWQHGQTHAHAVISRRALCTVPGRDRMPRCSMSRRSSQS